MCKPQYVLSIRSCKASGSAFPAAPLGCGTSWRIYYTWISPRTSHQQGWRMLRVPSTNTATSIPAIVAPCPPQLPPCIVSHGCETPASPSAIALTLRSPPAWKRYTCTANPLTGTSSLKTISQTWERSTHGKSPGHPKHQSSAASST